MIEIRYFRASMLLLNWGGLNVLTDPWFAAHMRGLPVYVRSAVAPHDLPSLDLVLVSHLHPDHFDSHALTLLRTAPKLLIGPPGLLQKARGIHYGQITEMSDGDEFKNDSFTVRSFALEHSGYENGYLLERGSMSIFFGGDAKYSGAFATIGAKHKTTVALLPVGGTEIMGRRIVMNADDAYLAASDLGAKVVVPIHCGGEWMSVPPLSRHPGRAKDLVDLARAQGEKIHIVALSPGGKAIVDPAGAVNTIVSHDDRWRLPASWRPAVPVFAFHEDSNANAVLITPEGRIYAVAEERLSRNRFQAGFPQRARQWLEQASGINMIDAPALVFGNRTHFLPRILGEHFPTFEHDMFGWQHKLMLLYQHLCFLAPQFASLIAGFNRLLLKLRTGARRVEIYDHHFSHAASAYYTSGFEDAMAVTADNFGDGYAAKVFDCSGSELRFIRGVSALNSPGQFYGEIAQIAGIHPLLAGKLTGMAASGKPEAAMATMKELFDVTPDKKNFTRTFAWNRSARRAPFAELKNIPLADLAASAQLRLEEALTEFVRAAAVETGRRKVVLAGGSFANVRLNQRVRELPEVDAVWIHPAMTDQGIAMGAALAHIAASKKPLPFKLENILLGPEPTETEMEAALAEFGLPYERPENIAETTADLLAGGKVIARFDGPLEYGPRALGNRSILYQIQDATVSDWLNARLRRASYMPFAPMTMGDFAEQCYIGVAGAREAARFMTISFHATDWMKQNCPGVVHIDGTVRPQLLWPEDNPGMYAILDAYHRRTGLPSLLNTSFNMHHEPIVATARDACLAFMQARLDALILGPYLVFQREE